MGATQARLQPLQIVLTQWVQHKHGYIHYRTKVNTHVAIGTAFHKVWHTVLTTEITPGQGLVFTHKMYLRYFESRSYLKRNLYIASNITTIRKVVLY
jgi:hypothetical protein